MNEYKSLRSINFRCRQGELSCRKRTRALKAKESALCTITGTDQCKHTSVVAEHGAHLAAVGRQC